MAKKAFIPQTGIESVIGLPGSGKSFFMVREAIDIILTQKRPVYTNLPLQLPTIRAYLRKRGGAEAANLIRLLEEDHFRKFLDRFGKRAAVARSRKACNNEFVRLLNQPVVDADFLPAVDGEDEVARAARGEASRKARCEADCRKLMERFPDYMYDDGGVVRVRKLAACWAIACEKYYGPDIESGPDANYIPVSAAIMVDEVQHWFPGGTTAKESKELVSFLTMHRHGYYLVYFATQHFAQMNVSIRRNCVHYHVCQDMGLRDFVGGITFGAVGLRHFVRYQFLGGQSDEPDFTQAGALGVETFWAQMPWNRWVFRMYKSHTHLDSPRAARKILNEARERAGLAPLESEVARRKIRSKLVRRRWVFAMTVIAFFLGLFMSPNFYKAEKIQPPKFPYTIQGVGDDFVQLDIGLVDRDNDARDVHWIASRDNECALLVGHDVWVLHGQAPKYIGPATAVGAAIRARLGAAAAATSGLAVGGEVAGGKGSGR